MKNRFLKYTLTLAFLTCLCYNARAQNVQAEAKLQQYTIRIGDQTKLFLSVTQNVKEHVNFPKLADTIISKLLIVHPNKGDTVYDQKDRSLMTVTQSYTITSFDAGTYIMPPFAIGTAKGVVKTNELTLLVQSVKVDTTKAIYDIKQPLQVKYTILDTIKDNWYWIVFPLVALALIAGLILYLRKRPKAPVVVQVVKQPAVPAHIIALNQLKALRDKKLWQQDEVKLYYSELSDIIREYLEKRFVIKTHEKTTDEIFTSLRQMSISNDNRNKLRQILVLADLVKFAKENPSPAVNEERMELAMDFVTATQPADKVTAAEGGQPNV